MKNETKTKRKTTYRTAMLTLVTLTTLWGAPSAFAGALVIPTSERDVLLELYNSTNGANWSNNSGWNGAAGTECSWFGVTCAVEGSAHCSASFCPTHVVSISLTNNNLNGTIQNVALTALPYLNNIEVGSNTLTGVIPDLAGLTNLGWVDFSWNQLTGPIPDLADLTNLANAYFEGNQLTGSMPSLSGLSNLFQFDFSYNKLTKSIPSLSGLTGLEWFSVGNNQLTGSIPSLAGLTGLKGFDVSYNQLTGPLPDLSDLIDLEGIQVDHNSLSGPIPAPPSNLQFFGTEWHDVTVCPNHLTASPVAAVNNEWSQMTSETPWYSNCPPAGPVHPILGH